MPRAVFQLLPYIWIFIYFRPTRLCPGFSISDAWFIIVSVVFASKLPRSIIYSFNNWLLINKGRHNHLSLILSSFISKSLCLNVDKVRYIWQWTTYFAINLLGLDYKILQIIFKKKIWKAFFYILLGFFYHFFGCRQNNK